MTNPTQTTMLNIARVDYGGNTGAGKYFYSFNQSIISVTEPETIMTFQLTEDTPSQVVLTGLISSDAMSQLVDIQIATDGRSITLMNKNTVEYLIQLAFLAYDEKSGDNFICDPQVINIPRPPTA